MLLIIFVATGCQTNSAFVDEITLPNGKKGLSIDCTNFGLPGCFKEASKVCKNGYDIYERTTEENTKTEIPVSKMDRKESTIYGPMVSPARKDKYMIISCK